MELPKKCPKCGKETEWLLLSYKEALSLQQPFLEVGLIPPDGFGALGATITIVTKRKCSFCGYFITTENPTE